MLLSGKVGAGKSVTIANLVDDLSLQRESVVFYFFCRHDNPESLKCQTILGSLTRQYLSEISVGSQQFTDDIPTLDTAAMTRIMVSSTNKSRTYVLIDGLDECRSEERRGLLQCLAEIQGMPGWHLGLSARLSAEVLFGDDIIITWHISMPNLNPDIERYVDSELSRRKDSGELVTSDAQLITEIREALLKGYNGMFLWVSLQLDAVCFEASDHDIRQALASLPKDLADIYTRILKSSAKLDHKRYHVRLFKFITAAFEPLSIDQIKDIMSVRIGDTSWDPSRRINDVIRMLKFCGSLVMIDEEEQTVRFVHHTARRFCLGALGGSLYGTLPFTEIEAHQELGEITVTYMNYGIFGRQLSTRVVPKIDVRKIPEQISHATIGSPRFTRNLFKRTPAKPRDIGPTLTRLDPSCTTGNRSQGQHPFYSYAQRFWLLQSRHMIKSNMRSLWDQLVHDPDALNIQVLTFTPHLVGLLDNIEAKDFTPEIVGVIWALNYSHVFLFDHLMGSKRDHKLTVRGLVRQITLFLKYFKALSTQPSEFISVNMVSEMTLRLLPIAIELRAYDAVQRIIQWASADSILHSREEDMRRQTRLPNSSREDSIRRAAQIVRSTWDIRMLRLLVKGRLSSFGDNTHMIEGFLKSQIPQEVLLRHTQYAITSQAALD
uniref:Nacht domain protein n=1 Tax=Colletotrichum fructicola (strain Nara gc5) TaxID=1213859 RepID=L2FG23_COLFN